MKRKASIFTSVFLLMLSSCAPQEKKPTPTIDSRPSAPSQETTKNTATLTGGQDDKPTVTEKKMNKARLREAFSQLADATSFVAEIDYLNGNTFRDIYTDQYLYKASTNEGYLVRKSLNGKENQVYSFSKENGALLLHSQKEMPESGNIHEKNPFAKVKGILKEDTFLKSKDGYYSADWDLVLALSYALNLGFNGEEGDFADATFRYDANGNLVATLQVSNSSTGMIEDYASATFTKINAAHDAEIEAYIAKDVKGETIPETLAADLLGKKHTYQSKISYVTESIDFSTDVSTLHLSSSESRFSVTLGDEDSLSYEQNLYVKGDDSNAEKVTLSADNTVKHVSTGMPFASLLPDLSTLLEKDGFLKIGEETYRYLGADIASLYRTIGYVPLSGEIDYMDLTVSSGHLSHVSTVYTTVYEGGFEIHYVNETEVLSYQEPELPTPSVADDDTALIKSKFAMLSLKSDSLSSYTMKIYDNDDDYANFYTLVKVTEDVVLYERHLSGGGNSGTKILTTGIGKNAAGHYLSFAYTAEGNVYALGNADRAIQDTNDILGFTLAPELLKMKTESDGSKTLSLKQKPSDLGEHIVGGKHKADALPYSLKIKLSRTNSDIESLSYRYSYNNNQLRGEETVEFSNYNSTTIPEAVKTALATFPDKNTTSTWAVEEEANSRIVSYLGTEDAKKLPYLYEEKLYGKWAATVYQTATGLKPSLYLYVHDSGNELNWSLSEDPLNFMGRYAELLRNSGNFTEDKDGDGKTVFTAKNKTFKITFRGTGPQEGLLIDTLN